MAGMRQAVGAEMVWKNRSHIRRGLVRLFQTVYAQDRCIQAISISDFGLNE
jgi:hypothetical protein